MTAFETALEATEIGRVSLLAAAIVSVIVAAWCALVIGPAWLAHPSLLVWAVPVAALGTVKIVKEMW